ncbi:hypothetical protein V6N13_115113 [Hibiscus sabdariffa]
MVDRIDIAEAKEKRKEKTELPMLKDERDSRRGLELREKWRDFLFIGSGGVFGNSLYCSPYFKITCTGFFQFNW